MQAYLAQEELQVLKGQKEAKQRLSFGTTKEPPFEPTWSRADSRGCLKLWKDDGRVVAEERGGSQNGGNGFMKEQMAKCLERKGVS